MKIKLLIILLFVFVTNNRIYSQNNSNCVSKIIRTDPLNSANNEIPIKRNTNGIILNWLIDEGTNFNANSQFYSPNVTTLSSPFYQVNNFATDHFVTNRDRNPDDGWELIYRQFGYNDDGSLGSNEDNPFFILYNRYTGILRVFVVVANNKLDYQFMKIRLFFSDETNTIPSILDLALSNKIKPLRALDDFDNNLLLDQFSLTNITRFNNNPKKWFYADFPVMYDPCTCLFTSKLGIEIQLIKKAKIEITGLLDGVIADISNNQSQNSQSEVDEGKSSITMASEIGGNVINTYKTMNGFRDDINNHISEFYKDDNAKKLKAQKSLNLLENMIDNSSALKSIMNNMPILGAALSVVDYFTTGGKKVTPQNVRLMPASIKAQLSLTGSITDWAPFQNIFFWNPGSDFLQLQQPPYSQYPYYNKILGTFNLLQTPVIDCFDDHIIEGNINYPPYWVNTELHYKLSEPIKFVINPAAGFKMNSEDMDIMASIIVEFDQPMNNTLTTSLDPFIIKETSSIYRTRYVPLEDLPNVSFNFNTVRNFHNLPIPHIHYSYPKKVYLDIIANLKRNETGSNLQSTIFKGKYPVNVNLINYNASNWATMWSSPYLTYPLGINISNANISSAVDIKAWEEITISNNVTTQTGPIRIIAGESIIVSPNSKLSPNTTLEIGLPVTVHNQKYGPVTDVNSFCQSNQANGYKPTNRNTHRFNKLSILDNSFVKNFYLTIFPNPASSELNLRFSLPESTSMKLTISNMLGETLIIPIDKGNQPSGEFSIPVDVSVLSPGVYYCTMQCPLGVITKSFVVIK